MAVTTQLDLDKRDPWWIKHELFPLRVLLRLAHRLEIRGLENWGQGPYLLVANHSIGAVLELAALLDAWENHYGRGKSSKPVFGMAHWFPFMIPGMGWYLRKFGALPATHQSADQVLKSGHSLIVFPGGNYEALRPFPERNLCDFGGKKGWTQIALGPHAPTLIPISIVGSHSVNPVILRSQALSKFLVLPKLIKVRWFPVTVSQILYTALAVTWVAPQSIGMSLVAGYFVFLSTPLWPIWPAKIKIKIGKPLPVTGLSPDQCYEKTIDAIQAGMDELNGFRTQED